MSTPPSTKAGITPEYRRRDVRVAIIVHRLLHEPFLTVADTALALQAPEADAHEALDTATTATVSNQPS